MKKYSVNKISDKKVAVVEKTPFDTIVVKEFKNQKDARDFCSRLNSGKGFQGWTPTFIVDKTPENV